MQNNRQAADTIPDLCERHAKLSDTSAANLFLNGAGLIASQHRSLKAGQSSMSAAVPAPPSAAFHRKRLCRDRIDSSPSLIDICRTRFPNADWRVADMRHLRLAEISMDSSPGTASST